MTKLGFLEFHQNKKIRKILFPEHSFIKKLTKIKGNEISLSVKFDLNQGTLNKSRGLFFISEHIFLRNSYSNIISKQTSNVVYKKHVFDSLSITPVFKCFWYNQKTTYCIDFGTGGGFPGLLLSIFFPEIFISLIDSIQRKINFHNGIFDILELQNCNSICIRGENLSNSILYRKKYDIVTSRAVAELVDLLKIFLCISNAQGKFVAMKKISGCEKEIRDTSIYFSKFNLKLKCLVKIDRKNYGKVLILYKKL
jgi:16S rRNA (guanine527-N7)-methyltransferase